MEKQYCVGLEINANHIKSASDGYVYVLFILAREPIFGKSG
jgi:hypothetical protein